MVFAERGAMKVAALLSAFAAACASKPSTDPQLDYDPGPWFVGEQQTMTIEWSPASSCSAPFDCTTGPLVPFQLDNVTCTGCTTSGVELGQEAENATSFQFVATTTDAIEIDIEIDSDGDSYHLTATSTGDRELALVASCDVVWSDEIEDPELEPEPCGAMRTSDQAVLIDWSIQTLHGNRGQPFCPDGARCEPDYPRKLSQIQLSPAPQSWRADAPVYTAISTASVTMTVPLDTGALSTATIDIPSVQ